MCRSRPSHRMAFTTALLPLSKCMFIAWIDDFGIVVVIIVVVVVVGGGGGIGVVVVVVVVVVAIAFFVLINAAFVAFLS